MKNISTIIPCEDLSTKFSSIAASDRKDPFEIVSFIYDFVIANKWQWDKITYYNCKRIEFLIQEKVPANIANRREIYLWIVNNWNKYVFLHWMIFH